MLDLSTTETDRRDFLKTMGLTGLLAAGLSGCDSSTGNDFTSSPGAVGAAELRRRAAINFRVSRAQQDNPQAINHINNGDEARYQNFLASFSKTLPHNNIGEVDANAYRAMIQAIDSGSTTAIENVPRGGTAQLVNPLAGNAFTLTGVDGQGVTMRPAPAFDSPEHAGEMVELYWMALCRDIPFTDFAANPRVANAANELSTLTDFKAGAQTPQTVFRGDLQGDRVGPYISQFLLKDIPLGAYNLPQRLAVAGAVGVDYMISQADAVNIQRGIAPGPQVLNNTPHYISSLRDLASYVHIDALHQAYLQAALILLGQGAPFDTGFPYNNVTRGAGFATYGPAQVLGLVTEVSVRALKAAWFQKWNVHRRLRPEAMGLRVQAHMTNQAVYPIHNDLLNSQALQQVFGIQGTYTLSQAYPEGSPSHPSYGAGHAAVASACTTVLKALFDGQAQIINPVSTDQNGTILTPLGTALTVNGELNKLCSNISIGRDAAGVHYASDYTYCRDLGEQVGISIVQDALAASEITGSVTLQKFDGSTIQIA